MAIIRGADAFWAAFQASSLHSIGDPNPDERVARRCLLPGQHTEAEEDDTTEHEESDSRAHGHAISLNRPLG